MPRPDPALWPRLLGPAISYALVAVQAVTPELLPCPTPCWSWDVGMLLRHATESLAALQEGIDAGRIDLSPAPDDPAGDPAELFRDRAGRFLSAWTGTARTGTARTGTARTRTARTDTACTETPQAEAADTGAAPTEAADTEAARTEAAQTGADDWSEIIAIADRRLTLGVMTGVGALEMAVHGWDISRACGHPQPIPGALAIGLLHISPLLVPRTGRAPLFGPPVTVPAIATPSDQLVAYLGRNPA
jgi:uncharacterized protein (TIGR03086 family)